MKKTYLFVLTLFMLACLSVALPQQAYAHEHQVFKIGDKQYIFIVGSLNEPTFIDDKTGVDLTIKLADPANPSDASSPKAKALEGMEKTLKVEVSAGDKKKVFDLVPAWQKPGSYYATFFPTIQTTYNYRLFGTLNGTQIDLSFSCVATDNDAEIQEDKTVTKISDTVSRVSKAGAFGCPADKKESQFPEQAGSLLDLNKKVDGISSQLPNGSSGATLALVAGIAGIIIGVVALIKKKS